jgi:hypothetical protein
VLACHASVTECGSGAVPDPLSATVAGELVELLTKDRLPVAAPLLEGANPIFAVLLLLAATVNGNETPLSPKPEPVKLAEKTVTAELPVLVSVTRLLAEPPTTTDPNEIEDGEVDSSAVTGAMTVMLAIALELGSATLVAMSVAVPAVAGAV